MRMAKNAFLKFYNLDLNLKFLFLSSFLIPLSSFTLLPFLPIILDRNLHLAFSTIGIILFIMTFIQFGGSFVAGFIIHKTNERVIMLFALTTRLIGFIIFVFAMHNIYLLYISIILIPVGGSFYLPANKSYLVRIVKEKDRAFFLSISSSLINFGMVFAPVLGGLFLLSYPRATIGVISLSFLIILIIHYLFIVKLPVNKDTKSLHGASHSFKLVYIILIIKLLTFYFYFYYQNYKGPYIIAFNKPLILSYMLILNSLIVMIFQPLMSKFINNKSFKYIIFLSFIMLFIGFYTFYIHNIIIIFIGVIFISFAELMSALKIDLEMLRKMPNHPAISFGYSRLAGGIGGALSSYIGGLTYGYYKNLDMTPYFWLNIVFQGIVVFLVFFIFIFFMRKILKNYGGM